jgi:carboxypeptidase family protein
MYVPVTRNHMMRLHIFPLAVLAGLLISCATFSLAQEPAQPQPPASPSAESSSKQAQGKNTHGNDFLVRGTVFTPEGLALPGAELRIRRNPEKKFRWNDASNSRGEFAIRVKMGADYEVVVRAKGYQEQSQAVNAATGERFKDLVFHMQRQTGKKS